MLDLGKIVNKQHNFDGRTEKSLKFAALRWEHCPVSLALCPVRCTWCGNRASGADMSASLINLFCSISDHSLPSRSVWALVREGDMVASWHWHFRNQWTKMDWNQIRSDQSLSRVQLCDPMNRSTPGLPVHHQLPEFTETQVHQVSDAIQPSHPLSSPFPPAPNPSQHQGLFQWINSSHEVAKVLEFQL